MKHIASGWTLLAVLVTVTAACQPDDPCDPGFEVRISGCVPVDAGVGDGGDGDGDGDRDGDASDSGVDEPGQCEAGEGSDDAFGAACQTDADCDCPAPVCLTMGLDYCSRVGCMDSAEPCPDGYNCVGIPEAYQMDGISSVCLKL